MVYSSTHFSSNFHPASLLAISNSRKKRNQRNEKKRNQDSQLSNDEKRAKEASRKRMKRSQETPEERERRLLSQRLYKRRSRASKIQSPSKDTTSSDISTGSVPVMDSPLSSAELPVGK
jgi:hypothetical protein